MNTVTVANLSREQCVVLMTMVHIEELKDAGLLEGGALELTDSALAKCNELKSAGFAFNPGELEGAFAAILRETERLASGASP